MDAKAIDNAAQPRTAPTLCLPLTHRWLAGTLRTGGWQGMTCARCGLIKFRGAV
jgi:hypothetical protein